MKCTFDIKRAANRTEVVLGQTLKKITINDYELILVAGFAEYKSDFIPL